MNNLNKKNFAMAFLGLFLAISGGAIQAQTDVQKLKSFNKIIVSPRVQLELVKGDQESIELEYRNINPAKVNVEVSGKTLKIYLDDAKYIVKNDKSKKYHRRNGWWDQRMYDENVQVRAYVTYNTLKRLQVRGEEDIEITSPLEADRFKLKLYGESVVRISSLKTNKFKAVLIGENRLEVKEGNAKKQKYKSIGENWVRADGLESEFAIASFIGEGRAKIKANDHLRVSSIGESEVVFSGNPRVRKGIVLGYVDIRKDW
ncbi:MAG: DUF2807 domain-containing protein [Bacteroidota bacterium]